MKSVVKGQAPVTEAEEYPREKDTLLQASSLHVGMDWELNDALERTGVARMYERKA